MLRAEIEIGRVGEEEGHDIVTGGLVHTDRLGEIPAVDRGVEDSHRQQVASCPIASRVMCNALERAVLVKARDDDVGRRDERRQRVVAKMVDGTRRFDLLNRCTV